MDANSIKREVIKQYGRLAKASSKRLFNKLFACCDENENVQSIGKAIGYSEKQLAQVPQGANLGVGCGNPSAHATIQKGDWVVDLGAGAGFDAFLVAPLVGRKGKVIGIDLSEEMIQLAQKNARKGSYNNVEFIKGDIEAIPLKNHSVDHIISNCVINLSHQKAKVFQEAYRVLKSAGRLTISDIVLEAELPDFVKNSLAGHIACIASAEPLEAYQKYLSDAGFHSVSVLKKTAFPLALMLNDPQLQKMAKAIDFNLNSNEAADIASRVISVSISAIK